MLQRIVCGWLVLGVMAVGCLDLPEGVGDQQACATLCQCAETQPDAVERCHGQCMAQLTPIPEDCQACIASNAERCANLLDECSNCFGSP